METLERPVAAELEDRILRLLQKQGSPNTLEDILTRLREDDFVYKHEIASTVWRLANEGKIVVQSGRITSHV
jgi:hypothetical protein